MGAQAIQVVVTSGPEDVARAKFALQVALASVVSGVDVHVFLVLEAGKWVCEPRGEHSDDVYALIDQLEELGARVTYCSSCVVEKCSPENWAPSRAAVAAGASAVALHPQLQASGLTDFIEGVVKGIPTVTI